MSNNTTRFCCLFTYCRHFLTAQTEYNLHSPFVFDFYTQVVKNTFPYKEFENLKRDYSQEKSLKLLQLFFKTARYFKPQTIVKIGETNSSDIAYLALGNKEAKVFVLDAENGSLQKPNGISVLPNVEIFNPSTPTNIQRLIESEITANNMVVIEMSESNIPLVESFFRQVQNNHIFIFKGIHQNKDTEKIWADFKAREEVQVSVDLFFAGFLFFRKELSKQDFLLRF